MLINKSKQFEKLIVKYVVFLRFIYTNRYTMNPLKVYMISNY